MHPLTDANGIVFAHLSDNWKRPPGRPCCTWIWKFATTCPHLAWSCQ